MTPATPPARLVPAAVAEILDAPDRVTHPDRIADALAVRGGGFRVR